jgi:hypothetical protein
MTAEPVDHITLSASIMDGAEGVQLTAKVNDIFQTLDVMARFLAACGYGEGRLHFVNKKEEA